MYPEKQVQMVPEGPLRMPTTIDRVEYRKRLQVAESKRLIVLAGYLRPYKGLSSLLEGAAELPDTFAIRVAGYADRKYQDELGLILKQLKSQNIDIDIAFKRLADNEYGAFLNAADFMCVPFKEINNSGSINSALCAGVPVIIPNIPSLNWVPKGTIMSIPVSFDGKFDFRELFQRIAQISVSEYNSMTESALEWAATLSWQDVAKQHIDLYADLGGENNENYARDKS
jgi:glycosyltransferase involved in cell wall biosynthesis